MRYAILALGIAGLALAGVFYKLATAPTFTVVAYRMLFAALLMAPLVFISRKSQSWQRRAPFSRADILATTFSGALFALDVTLWAESIRFTSVSSAALLVSMEAIFVPIFAALLFAERSSWPMIAGMAVATCGAAIVTVGDFRISGRALTGDALALSAAFAESGYLLLGRHVRRRVDTLRYAMVVYSACAVFVWLAVVGLRIPVAISAQDLTVCLALALVATVMGHTLVSQSLGTMPAAVVAISFLSQPIIAAFFAYLVLHQIIAPLTAIGGAVALLGIGIVAFANERAVASGPPEAI